MNKQLPFKTSVTYGRFNLPHKGHLDLFQQMAEVSDRVVIGLSNHPDNLPTNRRLHAIGKLLSAEKINYSIIPARQPFELLNSVAKTLVPEETVAFFGQDQFKLAAAVTRVMGWQSKTIERLSASTLLRSLIDNEDWDLLSREIPASIFNEVIELRRLEIERNNLKLL